MRIAHVCPGCGADLALTRPRIEPVYGLPLVWCVRCERPSVRRTHPLVREWSGARAAGAALLWLALKLVAAIGLWMLALAAIRAAMGVLVSTPGFRDEWAVRAAVGLCVATAISHGAWITAGLSHLSRRAAWLGWAAFLYGATAVVFGLYGVLGATRASDSVDSLYDWLCAAIGFTLILLAAPIGIPLGSALLRLRRAGRRRALRKLRARRRRGEWVWA